MDGGTDTDDECNVDEETAEGTVHHSHGDRGRIGPMGRERAVHTKAMAEEDNNDGENNNSDNANASGPMSPGKKNNSSSAKGNSSNADSTANGNANSGGSPTRSGTRRKNRLEKMKAEGPFSGYGEKMREAGHSLIRDDFLPDFIKGQGEDVGLAIRSVAG